MVLWIFGVMAAEIRPSAFTQIAMHVLRPATLLGENDCAGLDAVLTERRRESVKIGQNRLTRLKQLKTAGKPQKMNARQ